MINYEFFENEYNDLKKGCVYDIYAKGKTESYHYTGRWILIKMYKKYILFENLRCGYKECFLNNQGLVKIKEL